jgi:hypothetical protein
MTRSCVAIRHVAFEDLGLLGPLLAARGPAAREHGGKVLAAWHGENA